MGKFESWKCEEEGCLANSKEEWLILLKPQRRRLMVSELPEGGQLSPIPCN